MENTLIDLLKEDFLKAKKRKKRNLVLFFITLMIILVIFAISVSSVLLPLKKGHSEILHSYLWESDRGISYLISLVFPLIFLLNSVPFLMKRRTLEDWPLYQLAINQKDKVAWVYKQKTNVRVYGVKVTQYETLVICNKRGKRFSLYQIEKERMNALLAQGEALFPWAAIGWSQERESQYVDKPWTLLRG